MKKSEKAVVGTWRITAMEALDADYVEPRNRNRARSALTHWVNIFEGKNLSAHHLSRHKRSGQLRFLG
jgi:hypothetical protein